MKVQLKTALRLLNTIYDKEKNPNVEISADDALDPAQLVFKSILQKKNDDGVIGMRVAIPIDGGADVLAPFSIPLKHLLAVADSTGADGLALLEQEERALNILADGRRFRIAMLPNLGEELPRSPDKKAAKWSWNGPMLANQLDFVARAMCKDATRFHLCSCYFDSAIGLQATDGHRLHLGHIKPNTRRKRIKALLPTPAPILAMAKLAEVLDFAFDLSPRLGVTCSAPGIDVTYVETINDPMHRRINDYPDVKRILAKSDIDVAVDPATVMKALRLAGRLTGDEGIGIVINKNGLKLELTDGSFSESVAASEPFENSDFNIDRRYLAEALAGAVDEVRIGPVRTGFGEPIVVTRKDGVEALIMPRRE